MAYSYTYLPEVAIADAAFDAQGDTLPELFVAAALATAALMVNLDGIRPNTQKHIKIEAANREDLLYQWLSELVYVKDVEYLILVDYDLTIKPRGDMLILQCSARGEKIDPRRHELGQDVKAVTYHLFAVKEINGKFEARVVLDL